MADAPTLPRVQYVVDESGGRSAVLLALDEYERLLDYLEELEDALELSRAVSEDHDLRPYDEVRDELRRDGVLTASA